MKAWGIYILFFLNYLANLTYAQALDPILSTTNSIYEIHKKTLRFPKATFEGNPFTSLTAFPKNSSIHHHQIELKKTTLKFYKHNLGLSFKANANYNLNVVPDEEANINIRSSVRTELEWKLLKNGFLSHRNKALLIQNEVFQLETQAKKANTDLWRRQLKREYIFAINEEIKTLLVQKQQFLNQYFDVIQQLYQQKYLGRTEIISLGHQIHNNQQKLQALKQYNKTLQDSSDFALKKVVLPLIQVLPPREVTSPVNTSLDLALAHTELQSHWSKNINFSLYINHNWVSLLTTNRTYTGVGLRFSIPLCKTYENKLTQQKQNLIKAQYTDQKSGTINRWMVQFSQYQEKIKDLNLQFKNWELIQEQLRVAQILKEEFSPDEFGINNLSKQLELFDIKENVLEIKKQLYQAIIGLNVMVPNLTYIPFKFKIASNKTIPTISSEKNYSYEFQLQFLKAKGIHKIHAINPSKKLWYWCKKYDIKVENTPSSNSKTVDLWISKEFHRIQEESQPTLNHFTIKN